MLLSFGHKGDSFELNEPVDIVTDYVDGKIRYYIADRANHRIVITTEFGEFIGEIRPTDEDGKPLLDRISDVAIDNSGDIWVSESINKALFRFNSIDSEEPLSLSGSLDDILNPRFTVRDATIKLRRFLANVENSSIPIKPYAQIVESRTMMPVRWLMEHFYTQNCYNPMYESTVSWDTDESKATIYVPEIVFNEDFVFESKTIELWQGQPTARVNGKVVSIDPDNPNVTIQTIDDRLFVPLRFIAEKLDTKITWISPDSQPESKYGMVRMIFPDMRSLSQ